MTDSRHALSRRGRAAGFRTCRDRRGRVRQIMAQIALIAGLLSGGIGDDLLAQETPPAAGPQVKPPFSETATAAEASRGTDLAWQFELADSAMRGGYHALAERLYQEIERKEIEPGLHRRATFGRIDAWIGQGRGVDAALALEAMPGARDEFWRLRRGLAHYLVGTATRTPAEAQREFDGMNEMLVGLHPEMFAREAAWLFFLRGVAAVRVGNAGEAEQNFGRAEAIAISETERAMLRVARLQIALAANDPNDAMAKNLQDNAERHAGRQLGWLSTLQYAVVLDRMGEKARAVAVLKRQRESLPAVEADLRDQTLLLLGLIAGASNDDGRQAFRELLERGRDPDFQRIALMRLATAVRSDTTAGAGADLKRLLTTLLDRPTPHPLTEELLFFRAELALRVRAFEEAENDARAVLTRFPGSNRLRREALSILASSSWQRLARYRTAADYLAQMQALPDISPADKAQLALLQGECYFRAARQDNTVEDYRNAAEAYGAIQAGGIMPAGVSAGVVFFQRVLALIRARAIDAAVRLLDDPAARAGVDVESWWQAEWSLAREFQLMGRGAEAIARIDAMGPAAGVPAELRLRFLWLAAQVSLDGGSRDDTEARVAQVRQFVDGPAGAELSAERRADVMSNGLLLAAEAPLRQGDREGGRAALARLRTEFPESRASDFSYIMEAGYLAAENRLVDAMQQLLRLADSRPNSPYAPEALYQAALLSIQRGQKEHLDAANRLLEQLARQYEQSNYVFQARLKQAEVKLSLNSFSEAEAIYIKLEDTFAGHRDQPIVQISLAGALMAQASVDPGKFSDAVSRFERLLANENLPVDLRAEAGARLAEGWQAQGNTGRAAEICWEVYRRFVEDPKAATQLGATGPTWISRAILLLGDIEERESRFENARRLYQAVIDHGLPGDKVAAAKIAKIRAPLGTGG